jgi:hypothetical protein
MLIMSSLDSLLWRRFDYIQGTENLTSELALEDRWMVAKRISPKCFVDSQMPTADDYDGDLCHAYPFANDSIMQLAHFFQTLSIILDFFCVIGFFVGSLVAFSTNAPVTDPWRRVPAINMVVASAVNVLPLILFYSKTLCHNVSQSQNASDEQPFALIIVQPYCDMGAGGYFSIIGSISWLICAQALLIPDPGVYRRHEWETVPTDLELTTEMSTVKNVVGGNHTV